MTVRADGTPLLPDDMVAQAYANTSPSSGGAFTRHRSGDSDQRRRGAGVERRPPAADPDAGKADVKTASTRPTGKTGTIADRDRTCAPRTGKTARCCSSSGRAKW